MLGAQTSCLPPRAEGTTTKAKRVDAGSAGILACRFALKALQKKNSTSEPRAVATGHMLFMRFANLRFSS